VTERLSCHRAGFAIVSAKGQRELQVEPIDRRVTYHHVKAREVVEIWHRRRRRNRAGPTEPNGSS
jgi:hypothetical protein